MSSRSGGRRRRRVWLVALCAVAFAQIALGLAGLGAAAAGVDWCRRTLVQDWQRAVVILVFTALAVQLFRGAARDERVLHLGALFLLVAGFYAHPPIEALAGALPPGWAVLPRAVSAWAVGAFTPTLAWLFFRDFPRALEGPRSARTVDRFIRFTGGVGLVMVAANLAIAVRPEFGAVFESCGGEVRGGVLAALDRADPNSFYWLVVFGLVVPLLAFVPWRVRRAPADERRRVRIFTGGLALAAIPPVAIAVLPPLSPALQQFMRTAFFGSVVIPINLLAILSMAAITSYAVVVQNVLSVGTLLRQAAQYWLARIVVLGLAAAPFALLTRLLYRARAESLDDLFAGSSLLGILALLGAGALVLATRRRLMLGVDRLFFREAHDAPRIFATAADRMREAASTGEVAGALTDAVERALHPESIGLLVRDPGAEEYASLVGTLRRLPLAAALSKQLQAQPDPLPVDLAKPDARLQALPTSDRVWLADTGARLIVPLPGAAADLVGLLVLGAKRSELPYSRADRMLLSALARAAGNDLEGRALRASAALRLPGPASEEPARECAACGHVAEAAAASCPECGGGLRAGLLPLEPFGKFRLERRIGVGGMGVVYRARDLTLERPVALKTLPRTSPEDSVRLRREARAMAAITHPNLALILGAESWRGTPILVIEYLAGGTLAERIEGGPRGVEEAFDLAAVMARVLARAHGAGILHRDLKPSNIGFTGAGEAKLLDFGLARIAGDAARVGPTAAGVDGEDAVGTPLYMSPEALRGERPEVGFDLWGLAVVAFEAASGRHPFERASGAETWEAIRAGWTDEVAARMPACPEAAAKLFASALSPVRADRPATATELEQELRVARAALL